MLNDKIYIFQNKKRKLSENETENDVTLENGCTNGENGESKKKKKKNKIVEE